MHPTHVTNFAGPGPSDAILVVIPDVPAGGSALSVMTAFNNLAAQHSAAYTALTFGSRNCMGFAAVPHASWGAGTFPLKPVAPGAPGSVIYSFIDPTKFRLNNCSTL